MPLNRPASLLFSADAAAGAGTPLLPSANGTGASRGRKCVTSLPPLNLDVRATNSSSGATATEVFGTMSSASDSKLSLSSADWGESFSCDLFFLKGFSGFARHDQLVLGIQRKGRTTIGFSRVDGFERISPPSELVGAVEGVAGEGVEVDGASVGTRECVLVEDAFEGAWEGIKAAGILGSPISSSSAADAAGFTLLFCFLVAKLVAVFGCDSDGVALSTKLLLSCLSGEGLPNGAAFTDEVCGEDDDDDDAFAAPDVGVAEEEEEEEEEEEADLRR